MRKVYKYAGKNTRGKIVQGIIFGSSEQDARARLKEMRYTPYTVKLDLDASVSAMTSGMDLRELARFYGNLGRRMQAGADIPSGIHLVIDLFSNANLKTTLGILHAAVSDGMPLAEAMQMSGLPKRDAAIIRAMEKTGRQAETLISLGEETARQYKLQRTMASLVRKPMIFFGITYILLWAAIVFAIPVIERFFKALPGATVPPFAQKVYAAVDLFNAHVVANTMIYVALGIAGFMFVKSAYLKSLIDRIPAFKRLSERADQGSLWGSYALMYSAGVNSVETARLLAHAAGRQDGARWFSALARMLEAGKETSAAIAVAGFPKYIVDQVTAAYSTQSGDGITHGIQMLANNLMEDVLMLSESVAMIVDFSMQIMMALVVFGFFLMTVYPMLSSTLAQV